MPDPRDFLPMLPWEGPPIPNFLLDRYPFLRDVPYNIWRRFWPFEALPDEEVFRVVRDSKGAPHILEGRVRMPPPGKSFFLDGRHIVLDWHFGWSYVDPYGGLDRVLKENVDIAVFGKVMGIYEEE